MSVSKLRALVTRFLLPVPLLPGAPLHQTWNLKVNGPNPLDPTQNIESTYVVQALPEG